ncbi:hypothetical protein [Streptomyces sediminimaris]|uniref:hypothetical protein n=1 Tax=Streptomyces sediminimaris TaxID=3383721 RepID=UPI00399C292D
MSYMVPGRPAVGGCPCGCCPGGPGCCSVERCNLNCPARQHASSPSPQTTATEPHLTLFSSCLLSKWGFNDGNDPDVWLDYCETHGIDYNALDFPLAALVRKHLLPALEQTVTVCDIETSHNPIRVEAIDGKDIIDLWHQSMAATDGLLTPDHVDVPMADVLRLALDEACLAEPPPLSPPLPLA